MNEKDIARFWGKVQKTTSCWLWIGRKNSQGYGYFWLGTKQDGKDRIAHRVAYEIAHGCLPSGMHVLHRCDNPSCVRPDHLWAGTHTDNMHDMFSKGRRRPARGERNGNSRLTMREVNEIRDAYVPKVVTCKILARRYGVTPPTIHRIICGRTWTAASVSTIQAAR